MEELVQSCAPGAFCTANRELDSRNTARQLLEFAFGIKAGLVDGKTDFIQNKWHSTFCAPSTVRSVAACAALGACNKVRASGGSWKGGHAVLGGAAPLAEQIRTQVSPLFDNSCA